MEIKTMAVVSDEEKSQRDFYDEIDDAERNGWVVALTKHKRRLSFCILYKEVDNEMRTEIR